MQPPTRGRPSQPGRGREPARWTGLEIALILLSAVMIAYPLFAGAARFVAPPLAPAQESSPAPSDTPDPVFVQPTDTSAPPADTAAPPADTAAPAPSDTSAPPADTAAPPADTAAPAPSETGVPGGQQLATATSRPPTNTAEPATATATTPATADTPTSTSTTDPNITPTSTSTTDPNITPTNTTVAATATNTTAPVAGVRVFKVASVSEAAVGQSFSYSVSVITSSATDQQVSMSDSVSGNLEVLSASSGSGSCTTGQNVTCNLTVRADNPASVTIQVRVRAGVAPGTSISNSADAGGAQSGSVSVRVIGGSTGSPSPSPTGPTITPSTSPTGPTITPSTSPTGPTATQGAITVTPITPGPLTVTPTRVVPPATATTRPPSPPPPPDDDDGDDGGGGGGGGDQGDQPPAPPAPPTPIPGVPTEPPTPEAVVIFDPSQPQVRPTAAVRPTRVVIGATNTPSSLTPITPVATGSPQPTAGGNVGAGTDIFFRLASDWGSAYPGQQVNFTLAVRNTRASAPGGANDLRNVTVGSVLPSNLEVLGARADRGTDPTVNGNTVSYSIAQLQPGEGIEVTVATRIKPDVAIGTLLVAQGQLTYEGLAQAAFSNIVSVQVVGNAQPPTAAIGNTSAAQQATGTGAAYPGPTSPTAATAATAARTTTAAPSAQTARPTAVPTAVASVPRAPLPETSAGVPLLGIGLLGGTLLTRTWRIHRAKNRL